MSPGFHIFIETMLAVGKTYPVVIGSSYKACDILPWLSLSIFYHHILYLSKLWKNSASEF